MTATAMDEVVLDDLLRLLASRGFDLGGCKRPGLLRRIRDRMRSIGIDDLSRYHAHLESSDEELAALIDFVLVNVTGFFRGADAWAALAEDVLPPLLRATGRAPIRLWSAGCASGEEAFSLAMLFAEGLGLAAYEQRVRVFATDLDPDALVHARRGRYGAARLSDVPVRLRRKYFSPLPSGAFEVHPTLRRSVVFGRQDLAVDPPISRIDLAVCRNTLIYFEAATQARVLARLHFALRPHGVLFLGHAESIARTSAPFEPIDAGHRLFRKGRARPRRGPGSVGVTAA